MPTNVVSLLLYVALLLPGFCFAIARGRSRPDERPSAFQETAATVFASVICDAVVLAVVLLILRLVPGSDSYLARVVRSPAKVIAPDVSFWAFGTIAFVACSSLLGYVVGIETLPVLLRRTPAGKFVQLRPVKAAVVCLQKVKRGRTRVERKSTWHEVFERNPPMEVQVGAQMSDGSWVQGTLAGFNNAADDLPDRGIVLTGHLAQRPKGEAEISALNWSSMVINDRNIVYLVTAYGPLADETIAESGRAAAIDVDQGHLARCLALRLAGQQYAPQRRG